MTEEVTPEIQSSPPDESPAPEIKSEKPDKPAPVKPGKSKRKGLLSVNLDEILKPDTVKEETQPEDDAAVSTNLTERNHDFSFDDVLEAYNRFGDDLLKENRKSLNAVFRLITPVLEDRILQLKASRTHIIQLEEVRAELQQFMRDQLNNDHFAIQLVEIKEETTGRRPYTDREKFEDMVKDNPALGDLKDKFGLEFE